MADKILVADDEPGLLRIIEISLKAEGYEIVTAKNGREALEAVERERPDLVILDVMMPDMDGLEVCAALRESPDTADLPIILLSALSQVQDRIKGLRSGADEYVTKPVAMDELTTRVAALLLRSRRRVQSQPARRGKIIGFMGAKGGAGTSTVALNVANAFSMEKRSVILIELRSHFGTLARQLNHTPTRNLSHLVATGQEKVDERTLDLHLERFPGELRVLFGPQVAAEFAELDPGWAESLIKQAARMAELVILDLPGLPTNANQAAARLCDVLPIVMEPEASCLVAAKVMLDLLKEWGIRKDLTPTMVVNRAGLTLSVTLQEIRKNLGGEILAVMPHAAQDCASATERGVPLVTFRPSSLAATSMIDLAKRLSGENQPYLPM